MTVCGFGWPPEKGGAKFTAARVLGPYNNIDFTHLTHAAKLKVGQFQRKQICFLNFLTPTIRCYLPKFCWERYYFSREQLLRIAV